MLLSSAQVFRDGGILYVVYGCDYEKMAISSIRSVRERADWKVCVITNIPKEKRSPDWPEDVVFRFFDEPDCKAKMAKMRAYELTPFKYTLLLDADTLIRSDRFALPLRYLSCWDVCLVPHGDAHRFCDNEQWGRVGKIIVDLHQPCYASGVVYFRKSLSTKEFFSEWVRLYLEFGSTHDTAPMFMSLWHSSVRLWSLTGEPWLGKRKAYIVHTVGGSLQGRGVKYKPKAMDQKTKERKWIRVGVGKGKT